MKVHFLKEDALEALRTNFKSNFKHYSDKENDWIYEYFGSESPFIEYKQEFPEFELTFNKEDNIGKIDVNNTIVLYSAMKSLTDTQATDERLWAGMCHCDFWKFLHQRWGMSDKSDIKRNYTESRYFCQHGNRRSLIKNSLSKLWWIGRLTYDDSRTDPFELTRYLENDYATKYLFIFFNNYINNKSIAIGLLSALNHLEKSGYTIKGKQSKEIFIEATKYLNVISGTYILDYFTSEEITEKVLKHMYSLDGAN